MSTDNDILLLQLAKGEFHKAIPQRARRRHYIVTIAQRTKRTGIALRREIRDNCLACAIGLIKSITE